MKERDGLSIQLAYLNGLEEGKAHRGKRVRVRDIYSLAHNQGLEEQTDEFSSFLDGFREAYYEGEN